VIPTAGPAYRQGKKNQNQYNKRAARYYRGEEDKEKTVQSTLKFILQNRAEDGRVISKFNKSRSPDEEDEDNDTNHTDYLINFYDANETVNWRDVVQVRYDLVNSTKISCPICMEYLD